MAADMYEVPILFMKTGIMCSAPGDFYQALAEEYEAKLIRPDDVRLEITGGDFQRSRQLDKLVRAETDRRVRDVLLNDFNCVYDGFLNNYHRRIEVKRKVAHSAGAIPVLLCVNTHMDKIEERIRERHIAQTSEPGTSSVTTSLDEKIRAAREMLKNIEWPSLNDEENLIILNGAQSTEKMLDRVASFLGEELLI